MAIQVLKNKRFWRDLRFYLFLVILLPLWMWLYWLILPKKILSIAIIDKTVLNKQYQEHSSLFWVLAHEKYVKKDRANYLSLKDYFGFFPGDSGRYKIKGLERFNGQKISQLVQDCDMTYFTDTYGIYTQEWNHLTVLGDRSSLIYGGLSFQDLLFLKGMKDSSKLIVTEFNTIGSPTNSLFRQGFENLFGVKWLQWNGRYFHSFDTLTNKELPKWLYQNYMAQHHGEWPFKKDGLAFVNLNDQIVVLERGKAFDQDPFPKIITNHTLQEHYGLPATTTYSYWFDIMQIDSSMNEVMADFTLPVNNYGRSLLDSAGIPSIFPAIIHSSNQQKPFFYLAGDFCDNPINSKTVPFYGTKLYQWILFKKKDPLDRTEFFYTFYRPLISTILNDYYSTMPVKHKNP